jgi:hypothetical protein
MYLPVTKEHQKHISYRYFKKCFGSDPYIGGRRHPFQLLTAMTILKLCLTCTMHAQYPGGVRMQRVHIDYRLIVYHTASRIGVNPGGLGS